MSEMVIFHEVCFPSWNGCNCFGFSSGVLIFLTGQDEIEIACKKALEASRLLNKELLVFPLYAALSPEAQMRVFEPLRHSVSSLCSGVTFKFC